MGRGPSRAEVASVDVSDAAVEGHDGFDVR
jgi:hypothetical protein